MFVTRLSKKKVVFYVALVLDFFSFSDIVFSFFCRKLVDEKYQIGTLESSLELLTIFGETVEEVFTKTEVLALRNICGEGISLTHEEWEVCKIRFFCVLKFWH